MWKHNIFFLLLLLGIAETNVSDYLEPYDVAVKYGSVIASWLGPLIAIALPLALLLALIKIVFKSLKPT